MKNIYAIFTIIIFSMFFNVANAQNRFFEWMNKQTHSRDRLDLDKKIYFREVKAGEWLSIGSFTLDTNVLYDLPDKLSSKFFYFSNNSKVLFTVAGTGKVYQFDQEKKILTRLDKTYSKGYNFDAPQFVRNDTLYNFGGHGFWSYSKVLTYYDREIQEWHNIRAENFGPESFIEGYQGYAKQNDIFYSGGSEMEAGLKSFNRVFNDKLFAFDFKSLRWTLLGKINPELPFKSVRNVYWDGAHFIHVTPDKMFIIDPKKNEISVIVNPKYFHLKNFYSVGDSLFSYWENQSTQLKLSKKALLKEAKYAGKFYDDTNYKFYAYLIAGLVLMGFSGFAFYRFRRQKPNHSSALTLNKSDHFGALELILLKKLVDAEKQPDKFISVIQINEILKLEDKTPENQRRIRTKFLNNLNLKLLVYCQVEDSIIRFQSEEDKRLTLYRLKEEVKPALIALL
jgi:hypothetical protein